MPATAGPTELVAHLRARDAVIVCAAGLLRIYDNAETLSAEENPTGTT